MYERHLAPFVGRSPHVLEVGIHSGGSLDMWADYFRPGLSLYGVDIQEQCRAFAGPGREVFVGDQADPTFWERFTVQVPALDVILDDGGHEPHQRIATLEALLPHLRPGGVYMCEDIARKRNPLSHYLWGLTCHLNERARTPNHFQAEIFSVSFHPFVAVIERRRAPLTHLGARRSGDDWQQFS